MSWVSCTQRPTKIIPNRIIDQNSQGTYTTLVEQTALVDVTTFAKPVGCKHGESDEMKKLCEKLLEELPPIATRVVGTGTFIRHDKKIKVISAAHVCVPDDIPAEIKNKEITLIIKTEITIDILSQSFSTKGTIEKLDNENDLCLLSLGEEPSVLPVTFATEEPPRGSKIYYAGAPHGMMSDTFLMTFHGTFAGTLQSGLIFSLPCESGTSGSLIRDQHGNAFSMVQRMNPRFKHMCYGPRTELLLKFLK